MVEDKRTAAEWPEVGFEARPWKARGDEVGSRRAIRAAHRRLSGVRACHDRRRAPSCCLQTFSRLPTMRVVSSPGSMATQATSRPRRVDPVEDGERIQFRGREPHVKCEAGRARRDRGVRSANALLVVANVSAMKAAIALSDRLDESAIIEMHEALLPIRNRSGGRGEGEQVWIGGGSISPHSASFVPPHHDRVEKLMSRSHRLHPANRCARTRADGDRARSIRDDPPIS